jgi:hypothetical protein
MGRRHRGYRARGRETWRSAGRGHGQGTDGDHGFERAAGHAHVGTRRQDRTPARLEPGYLTAENPARLRDEFSAGESYSTVTVFARFRGWSMLRPRRRAIL